MTVLVVNFLKGASLRGCFQWIFNMKHAMSLEVSRHIEKRITARFAVQPTIGRRKLDLESGAQLGARYRNLYWFACTHDIDRKLCP